MTAMNEPRSRDAGSELPEPIEALTEHLGPGAAGRSGRDRPGRRSHGPDI